MRHDMIELTDFELDAVAAGSDDDVIDVDLRDINLNAQVVVIGSGNTQNNNNA
jgi:hypothetical protein